MEYSKGYKGLSKIIVAKFRDENFQDYIDLKNYCIKTDKTEFNQHQESRIDLNNSKLEKERYELLNGLSTKEHEILDRFILSIIDNTSFNVLREIEENLNTNESIGLTINGKPIEELTKEFWSGTCFGEYFNWLEQDSKFGNFQH